MKKYLLFVCLVFASGVVVTQNAYSSINYPVSAAAGDMKKCAHKNVVGKFTKAMRQFEGFANNIKGGAEDIVNDLNIEDDIQEFKLSIQGLEAEYTNMRNDFYEPLEEAYNSIDQSMIENMAAFEELTEAMKNRESREVYFKEAGKTVMVRSGVDEVSDDLEEALDSIPTYNEMDQAINKINSGGGAAAAATKANSSKTKSSKAMKRIGKFEKAMSKITGEKFSVNDMINDIDELKEAEKYLNLNKTQLPPALSTAMNVLSMYQAIQTFRNLNQVERVQQLTEFTSTLTSVATLNQLQTAAYDVMKVATQITDTVDTIATILSAVNFDTTSISELYYVYHAVDSEYAQVKDSVADLNDSVAYLQESADRIMQIKDDFVTDINNIGNSLEAGHDLGDLLDVLQHYPAVSPTVAKVREYMDIAGKALDFQQDILGFGADANSTEAVLNAAQPYVTQAKTKANQWKDDIKNYFSNPKTEAEKVEKEEKTVKKRESLAKKYKEKYQKYKDYKDKAEANLEYLEGVYATDVDALNKILAAKTKLQSLADENQINQFATDTLNITESVKDVMSAYKEVSKYDEEKVLGPLNDIRDKFESFSDVKDQLNEVQDLANDIASAQQVANGIANNIQNMGGLIKCFDIDVDAILQDLLLRVQDRVVEDLRVKVWDAYSEAVIDVPFLLLPEDWENEFNSPYPSGHIPIPVSSIDLENDLKKLAALNVNEDIHPLAGQQYAEITYEEGGTSPTRADLTYDTPVVVDGGEFKGTLDYGDTMKQFEVDVEGIEMQGLYGITWDFGDWKTTSWNPATSFIQCGFSLKNNYCWYWRWHSCWFISKCYQVPYPMPACMTNFDYKEPTVHVEIAPRIASSQLVYLSFLKDIPSSIDEWAAGGAANTVPAAHVIGISPAARYVSGLGPLHAQLTMTCDIAKKLDKWPYVQFYGLPAGPIELAKQLGRSLVDLKDWKKEWFTDKAPELGKVPASLQLLWSSQKKKSEWNPRAFPGGWTPSGETKPGYEDIRDESYKWALPYGEDQLVLDDTNTTGIDEAEEEMNAISNTNLVDGGGVIYQNKCDAGLPEDGTNKCIGDWGALFPRNGQVTIQDDRYPLKRYAQLAYRAYDKALEDGVITDLKKQPQTEKYGVGYDETEFSIDWPYSSNRYKVGEDPKYWNKGYFGESMNSGGMVMTLWKDTSCCVKVCCDLSLMGYHPGETSWYSSILDYWEKRKWAITEVSKHK